MGFFPAHSFMFGRVFLLVASHLCLLAPHRQALYTAQAASPRNSLQSKQTGAGGRHGTQKEMTHANSHSRAVAEFGIQPRSAECQPRRTLLPGLRCCVLAGSPGSPGTAGRLTTHLRLTRKQTEGQSKTKSLSCLSEGKPRFLTSQWPVVSLLPLRFFQRSDSLRQTRAITTCCCSSGDHSEIIFF